MSRAFFILALLQARGVARRMGRTFRKPSQAVLTVLGGGLLLLMFLPALLVGSIQGERVPEESILAIAPFAICLLLLTSLVAPKTALYFSPAAIEFLFGGPFDRRSILLYRMLVALSGAVATSALVALGGRVLLGSWFLTWIAFSLVAAFMYLVGLLLILLATAGRARLGPRNWRWLRFFSFAGLAVGLVHVWSQLAGMDFLGILREDGFTGVAGEVRAVPAIDALLSPFDFLAVLFVGGEAFWGRAAVAGGVCFVLGWLAWLLPVDYRDEAVRMSRRIFLRRQSMEKGDASVMKPWRFFRPRLPLFPAWGGAGPILWRQLLAGLRRLPGILLFGVLISTPGLVMFLRDGVDETEVLFFLIGGLVFLTYFTVSNGVTCDFRADIQLMDVLKSLPVSPLAMTSAQLAAPVAILFAVQSLVLLGAVMVVPGLSHSLAIVGALVLFLPVNFLLVALENLGILLFPTQMRNVTTDPMAMVRMMFFAMAKMLVVAIVAGIAAGVGFLVVFLTDGIVLGLAAGVFVVIGAALGFGAAVAAAFRAFDPASDIPT